MKNPLIIVLFVLICSCQSNNELNGVWVGPYRSSPFQNQATVTDPYVISFKNNEYNATGINFDEDKGTFLYSSKELRLNENELMEFASKPNSDSLAFKGTDKDPYPIVFRKLPVSLRSKSFDKIKLSGKKFTFDGIKNSDTLHFKNDSILYYNNQHNKTYYKRIYFEGYDMLFISDFRTPPLIIREKIRNKIKITSYPKEFKNKVLTEI